MNTHLCQADPSVCAYIATLQDRIAALEAEQTKLLAVAVRMQIDASSFLKTQLKRSQNHPGVGPHRYTGKKMLRRAGAIA
jgi:hypothetical protein